jgi:phosphate uptake regulator
MDLYESVTQNMKFLLIEVEKQIDRTVAYLDAPSKQLLGKVRGGDDYIDNLKTFIQTKCFTLASKTAQDKAAVARLKAFDVVSINLERISDFCERVIDQSEHLEDKSQLKNLDYAPFFDEVRQGLAHLTKALDSDDLQAALQVCRAEQQLDELYAKTLKRIIRALESGEHAQTQLTLLFISHYLERMGDSLLNGGEALLSARLGERIKIEQLRTLEDSLADIESDLDDVALHAVGETKSGARIARLTSSDRQNSVIFKEGNTKKLIEERDSVNRWQELIPGIVPNIYSFHQEGARSAILFEYLPGRTFEELLLEVPMQELEHALSRITETLVYIWQVTRRPEPASPRFMQQLLSRLDDIRSVHPEFLSPGGMIGEVEVHPYFELVQRCIALDESLSAPHSVYIHGDFNVDNVIYDAQADAVHFIDLHRSADMDYCQDVSVFLASNFRLQAFETEMRRRISWVIRRFYEFATQHAEQLGDTTFPQRLALGLARSFATSTRFVLDDGLSREMFLRSRFMLEEIVKQQANGQKFRFPTEVLFD